MSDERLLPTVGRLTGSEVLRVVGQDGKRMLMPVSSLLDAAVGRFATVTGEDAKVKALWTAVNSLTARLEALEEVWDANSTVAAGLGPSSAWPMDLRPELNALTERVKLLEAQIKLKKDK